MDINKVLEELALLQKKMYAYNVATSAIYLDAVTVAPKDTAEGRGVALGILAGESQKVFTAPEVGELLAFLKEHMEEVEPVVARQVEVLDRDYKQLSLIPAE